MNHALKAVIALGMGVGLAASANAHGTAMHQSRAMSRPQAQMSQRQLQVRPSRHAIRTAQQQLKADGLYKGKVDGMYGPETRRAVASFQQRNGLPRTAKLNQQTLNRLTGNQAVGVGSSTPQTNMPNLGSGNSNSNSNSDSNATTPMVPPASSTTNTGAGNNTGATTQNPSTKK